MSKWLIPLGCSQLSGGALPSRRQLDQKNMSEAARGERLQIMLTPEELIALDDWRFSRRMPSRASAVRELLRRGLAAEGFATADGGLKSQSFGVIATPPEEESA